MRCKVRRPGSFSEVFVNRIVGVDRDIGPIANGPVHLSPERGVVATPDGPSSTRDTPAKGSHRMTGSSVSKPQYRKRTLLAVASLNQHNKHPRDKEEALGNDFEAHRNGSAQPNPSKKACLDPKAPSTEDHQAVSLAPQFIR